MYQALLTRRYLTSKVMPLLAVLAVALCVAVELIVWSVMGGFLATLVGTGRTVMGDVAIVWPNSGFAHSEDLLERLEQDPEIEAASALIETFALLSLPDRRHETVIVRGVDAETFDAVTGFSGALWWRAIDRPPEKDTALEDWRYFNPAGLREALGRAGFSKGDAARLAKTPAEAARAVRARAGVGRAVLEEVEREVEAYARHAAFWGSMLEDGRRLAERDETSGEVRPAAVLGIEVSGFNIRKPGGWFVPGARRSQRADGREEWVQTFLPRDEVTMMVMPIDEQARGLDVVARRFPVANEFRTGFYDADNRVVLVPLATLQTMLKMGTSTRVRPLEDPFGVREEGGRARFVESDVVGPSASRVTNVIVKAREGVGEDRASERCRAIYAKFASAHEGRVPSAEAIIIRTWREQNATFIAAVEKEIALVMVIFAVISLTVVFLVLSIFWAMVNERTKDVGVLRALGASRAGIAWLWLRYGLAIGTVGGVLGLVMAGLVVWNINPIHEWMGEALGISVWDPRVYHFARIPAKLEPVRAAIIGVSGVAASVLGAWWPAWRAARMHPVKALRFD